jgi:hypothetical protein
MNLKCSTFKNFKLNIKFQQFSFKEALKWRGKQAFQEMAQLEWEASSMSVS